MVVSCHHDIMEFIAPHKINKKGVTVYGVQVQGVYISSTGTVYLEKLDGSRQIISLAPGEHIVVDQV